MEIRKTELDEVDRVLELLDQAKAYFKTSGIDQWQDGYPNKETILKDIEKGDSYILKLGKDIIGTTAISYDGDINYERIYDGEWMSDKKYSVVHRVSIDSAYKGGDRASKIFQYIEEISGNDIESIRVDTHRDNISMQKLCLKNGFTYCGIIYVEDGTERFAYEKLLKK